eukprot:8894292-Pyramimonas_sp.AAC.2
MSITVWASDKEPLDKESRVWVTVELQSKLGHGYHLHPHQIRNPSGSAASWAHSLTNVPTVMDTGGDLGRGT